MQKEEENQSNQPVSPSRDKLSQIPPETPVHCFAKLPNPHQALFKHPGTKTAAAAHAAEAKPNTPCLHCALGASSFYLLQFIGASDGEGFAFVSSPAALPSCCLHAMGTGAANLAGHFASAQTQLQAQEAGNSQPRL